MNELCSSSCLQQRKIIKALFENGEGNEDC